eukprot:288120_1
MFTGHWVVGDWYNDITDENCPDEWDIYGKILNWKSDKRREWYRIEINHCINKQMCLPLGIFDLKFKILHISCNRWIIMHGKDDGKIWADEEGSDWPLSIPNYQNLEYDTYPNNVIEEGD